MQTVRLAVLITCYLRTLLQCFWATGMGWGWGDFIAPMVNLHGVSTLQEKSSGERGVQQRSAQQAANIRDTIAAVFVTFQIRLLLVFVYKKIHHLI
ncbi:hypothetical protein KOW79_016878 [Hemibagrus wyckioides]|uniref:Uncharacterized protein n=1 Tax=Hemibagrus wyckioides TaxID=337641 RepID=A0A9D3NCQ0_9TELE|nr:hypothetical protein KOW79_016878 [Hemibagrus wyckioides]